MSFDGVWKVEILGPYDWETISTAFLENGRIIGASADHFSIGRYEEDGDTIKISSTITQHGEKRTFFGSSKTVFDVRMDASLKSTDEIVGKAYPKDGGGFDLNVRFIRLGDLA